MRRQEIPSLRVELGVYFHSERADLLWFDGSNKNKESRKEFKIPY